MKRWGDFVETGFQIINAIKSNNTCEQICELNESGILEKIIPEVKSMKEVGQCKYHKVDCFSHTIYALEEFEKLLVEDNFPNHLKKEIWKYLKSEVEENLQVLDLLKLGADDYMTKPFDLHELLARIEANLKRTSNTSCQNDTLTYRDIEINNSLVYIKEVLVSFTSTELKILRLLLQYPQKIFSKQNLYESIWNETYAYDDDTINTHISHIRKKIKAITNEDYIQTIWGIGYKIK